MSDHETTLREMADTRRMLVATESQAAACLAGADAHVLLRELVTLVRGECPSVLNEDSGGDGALSYKIDQLLAGAGADALRDVKEIAEAVHYYTGEDVDALVLRYRDEHAPTEPTR